MRFTGIFCILIAAVVISCNEIPDCDNPYTNQLILQFMDSLNMNPNEEIFLAVLDLETGYEFLLEDTTSIMVLEVNPVRDTTSYLLLGEGKIDTLSVAYSQNQRLISEKCGPQLRFSDLMIVKQTFRDTLLLNDELIRDEINFQIIR